MSRLSIELPDDQHKQIKALAAWHGLSLKDFIIQRTITVPTASSESDALTELMGFLAPRVEAAKQGAVSKLSMDAVIAKAKAKHRP